MWYHRGQGSGRGGCGAAPLQPIIGLPHKNADLEQEGSLREGAHACVCGGGGGSELRSLTDQARAGLKNSVADLYTQIVLFQFSSLRRSYYRAHRSLATQSSQQT